MTGSSSDGSSSSDDSSDDDLELRDATAEDLEKGARVFVQRGGDMQEAKLQGPSKRKEGMWAVKFASDGKVLPKPVIKIKIEVEEGSDEDTEENSNKSDSKHPGLRSLGKRVGLVLGGCTGLAALGLIVYIASTFLEGSSKEYASASGADESSDQLEAEEEEPDVSGNWTPTAYPTSEPTFLLVGGSGDPMTILMGAFVGPLFTFFGSDIFETLIFYQALIGNGIEGWALSFQVPGATFHLSTAYLSSGLAIRGGNCRGASWPVGRHTRHHTKSSKRA